MHVLVLGVGMGRLASLPLRGSWGSAVGLWGGFGLDLAGLDVGRGGGGCAGGAAASNSGQL